MKNRLKNLKLIRYVLITLFLVMLFAFSGNAQSEFTVTGTISDEFEGPLPGASVVEKGTTNGVSTDFDGNYSITVSNQNAILVISYIGYAEQEVSVAGNSEVNASLEPSASTLDEVVVVGYGSVKKKGFDRICCTSRCC